MPIPKKRAAKKAIAPKKKVAAKKLPKKIKPKGAPRVPRTATQLEAAKEARGKLLSAAILIGYEALSGKAHITVGAVSDAVRAALGPKVLHMDDSDWRNLGLTVLRHFEKQPGVLDQTAGYKDGGKGPRTFRIQLPKGKVEMERIKRRSKAAPKKKAAKKVAKKQATAATGDEAAPKKRKRGK